MHCVDDILSRPLPKKVLLHLWSWNQEGRKSCWYTITNYTLGYSPHLDSMGRPVYVIGGGVTMNNTTKTYGKT